MGWTETFNVNGSAKEYFDKSYNDNCEVLKSKTVKSCYYGAVRIKDENRVIAVVIPFKRDNLHGSLLYKSMDESMGPAYHDCPKSILDLLTPTNSEWANKWREKCRNRLSKISVSKLKVGSIFKTQNVINFNNGCCTDTFAVIKLWGKRQYIGIKNLHIFLLKRTCATNMDISEIVGHNDDITNMDHFCEYLQKPLL